MGGLEFISSGHHTRKRRANADGGAEKKGDEKKEEQGRKESRFGHTCVMKRHALDKMARQTNREAKLSPARLD